MSCGRRITTAAEPVEPTAAPPLDASQLSTDPQTEADEAELFADDITDEELSRIMGD